MRRFECECGNSKFNVNRDKSMVKCWECGKRFAFGKGAWQKLELSKEAIQFVVRIAQKPVEIVQETMGQLKKRLSEFKEKRRLKKQQEETQDKIDSLQGRKKGQVDEALLYAKWGYHYSLLKFCGCVDFVCNEHFHDLRGRHIAKALHKDLNRAGIKNRLSWTANRGARIDLVEEGN